MWSAFYKLPPDARIAGVIYALVALAMWPIPVFQVLHVESSAVVAFAAFFTGGWVAVGAFERGSLLSSVLTRHLLLLVIPWMLLSISVIWAPNCGYLQGLMFYALFPVITVVLAIAVGYLSVTSRISHPRTAVVGIGLAIVILGPAFDYLFHPQLYTYNHVFGGILGPIYDEELAIRPGLFVYRLLTLCWAALAISVAWYLQGRASVMYAGGFALLITAAYLFAPQLGFVTTESQIQRALGDVYERERITIYYDADSLEEYQLAEMADELTYRYRWLSDRLELDPEAEDESARPPEHIFVYLYPNPDIKAQLTGARYTSVAPLWLARPQMHLLEDRFASSAGHELAHVFTRGFAATRLNISPVAGLIEGAAVALEPPRGLPSPSEQVFTSALQGEYQPGELASGMVRRLRPLGFWTGRGAVSYSMVGSFANYLIEEYGAGKFRRVYRTGRFEQIYGVSLQALTQEWERSLHMMPFVAAGTADYVRPRFAAPSLFEQRCPHFVPRHIRAHREAQNALSQADTSAAIGYWEEALRLNPEYDVARLEIARIHRARGNGQGMKSHLEDVAEHNPNRWLLKGDAAIFQDSLGRAEKYYLEARGRVPAYQHEGRAIITMRRLLLASPDILSIWLIRGNTASAAGIIEGRAATSAERLLTGYLYLQGGESERAVQVWRTLSANSSLRLELDENGSLEAQWHRWMAYALYRSGQVTAARDRYDRAADAFRRIGAIPVYVQMQDAVDKMEFLLER